MQVVNGATLTDGGVIQDAGNFQIGNGSGTSDLTIAAGASFDFTTDDGNLIDGGGSAFANAGTIAKIGGTGTSTVGVGFINTGTVDAASGTLKLAVAVDGTGMLRIEARDTLELANASIAGGNTVALNGLGATLKIDTNSGLINPIVGLGGGSRIDLVIASSATAVINGDTLVMPTPRRRDAAGLRRHHEPRQSASGDRQRRRDRDGRHAL